MKARPKKVKVPSEQIEHLATLMKQKMVSHLKTKGCLPEALDWFCEQPKKVAKKVLNEMVRRALEVLTEERWAAVEPDGGVNR